MLRHVRHKICSEICYVQVMRTHGFNPSEEDLRDMIRNVDKNANGAIGTSSKWNQKFILHLEKLGEILGESRRFIL